MTSDTPTADRDRTAARGCPVLPLTSTTNTADPQAVYRRLREEWGNVARVELEPGVNAWLVMGWQELLAITTHEHIYSHDSRNWKDLQDGVVDPDAGIMQLMQYRDNVIGNDLHEHRRLRRPLDDAMAAIDQRQLRRTVETACAELIAGFADDGRADLLTDYASAVPLLAFGNLLGLDNADAHEVRRNLIAVAASQDDSAAAEQRLVGMLFGLLNARRAEPADDLATLFAEHPDLHDDSEILQALFAMITAGNETAITWIAQTLRVMLTDDRFAARMRGGRLGVDDALDEVLWADPPIANFPGRYALRDTVLGGRRIAKGDALIMCMTGANADPRIHPGGSPVEPGNHSHLAWGAGPHACPSQVPARIIVRTAVETVLHLLHGVRLAIPADEVRFNPSPWMRCPTSLPVTFNPTAAHTTPVPPAARKRPIGPLVRVPRRSKP